MPPTLATASIQGVGLLLSMDQRSAWPAAVRTDKRSGIKAKLSPRSGSALTSAHSVCILCFVNCHLDMFHCICWRPYHVECTGSLLTSEVKRHRARLVLGWGTAWENFKVLSALWLAVLETSPDCCCLRAPGGSGLPPGLVPGQSWQGHGSVCCC